MTESQQRPGHAPAGRATAARVRLGTLIAIRWIAIAGQLVALVLVRFLMGFPVPLAWALAIVALSAVINLFLNWRFPRSHLLRDGEAAVHLGYDLAQLGLLLYLTGGMTNPFALLLLVPVTISATILSGRSTAILLGFALALSLGLLFWHRPLPWAGAPLELNGLYAFGLWVGLALGMAFLALYAARVSAETHRRREALAATQDALAKEQQISALGALAAAAAHELGTPLATITIAAQEMLASGSKDESVNEDIRIIADQADRCRGILRQLAETYAEEREHHLLERSAEAIVEEAAQPARSLREGINISILRAENCDGPPPRLRSPPEIVHGLRNFIDNAVAHARKEVRLTLAWQRDELHLSVADDGPGFDSGLLRHLGEPYLSRLPAASQGDREGRQGLGLGIFIGKTLLERTGASVKFGNAPDDRGAQVEIVWPRPLPGEEAANNTEGKK